MWADLVPLRQLFASLAAVGFEQWQHVMVVLGGSAADQPPRMQAIDSLLTGSEPSSQRKPPRAFATHMPNSVAVVRSRYMMTDYHGLAALYTYACHPLVAARGYLYTLDTSLAHLSFPSRFDAVAAAFRSSECSTTVNLHT